MSNKHLRYEEELSGKLNEVSLPDENLAWENMRRRLDDEDDVKPVWAWWRSCALWGILGFITIAGMLYWWMNGKTVSVEKNSDKVASIQKELYDTSRKFEQSTTALETLSSSDSTFKSDSIIARKKISQISEPTFVKEIESASTVVVDSKVKSMKISSLQKRKKHRNSSIKNKSKSRATPLFLSTNTSRTKPNKQEILKDKKLKATQQPLAKYLNEGENKIAPKDKESQSTAESKSEESKNDTTSKVVGAEIVVATKTLKDSANKVEKSKDSKEKSKKMFWISVGIAEQQQIPYGGQKATPYNRVGRSNSLSDYVPSIYFRVNKADKWFIQTEFKYGAPQLEKNQQILKATIPDTTFGSPFTTLTLNSVKKSYYHQLPVSFHHYLSKNFSLGGGLVWNKFYGAVFSEDVIRRNTLTNTDSSIVKNNIISSSKADSNFAKSYFQAALEVQYSYKRFTLGSRYQFGLQPYLQFTLPSGDKREDFNRSLLVFLRYELWRSKKNR